MKKLFFTLVIMVLVLGTVRSQQFVWPQNQQFYGQQYFLQQQPQQWCPGGCGFGINQCQCRRGLLGRVISNFFVPNWGYSNPITYNYPQLCGRCGFGIAYCRCNAYPLFQNPLPPVFYNNNWWGQNYLPAYQGNSFPIFGLLPGWRAY